MRASDTELWYVRSRENQLGIPLWNEANSSLKGAFFLKPSQHNNDATGELTSLPWQDVTGYVRKPHSW